MNNEYAYEGEYLEVVSQASAKERKAFIKRTYLHLAGAVLAFVGIEALMFALGLPEIFYDFLGQYSLAWLGIILAFSAVGHFANSWALSGKSSQEQYLGLGLYVLTEAIIFMPILYVASEYFTASLIPTAGIITLGLFAGLTLSTFSMGKDFSFLGPILAIGSGVAIATIVAAMLFGFELGLLFSSAMILLASGYIIYSTSNVLNHYQTNQHVAASLALFASVALLFYYILTLLMNLNRD